MPHPRQRYDLKTKKWYNISDVKRKRRLQVMPDMEPEQMLDGTWVKSRREWREDMKRKGREDVGEDFIDYKLNQKKKPLPPLDPIIKEQNDRLDALFTDEQRQNYIRDLQGWDENPWDDEYLPNPSEEVYYDEQNQCLRDRHGENMSTTRWF